WLRLGSPHMRRTATSIQRLRVAISGPGQVSSVSSECQPSALLLRAPAPPCSRARMVCRSPWVVGSCSATFCTMMGTPNVSVMSGATGMARVMRGRSQDAEAAQGGVALAADDDVVVHGYAELLGRGRHLLGHGDVVGRRRRVAGRVVVQQTAQSNKQLMSLRICWHPITQGAVIGGCS